MLMVLVCLAFPVVWRFGTPFDCFWVVYLLLFVYLVLEVFDSFV